jgi:hypothetical protein
VKYYYISAQHKKGAPFTPKRRNPTIKQPTIIWVREIVINIATYSFPQDCSIHILPTNFITYIFLSLLPMLFYKWIHILYINIPVYYSNHVNKISYFLRHCQLYKNLYESQPEDCIMKKSRKHVTVIIFNCVLIVFT